MLKHICVMYMYMYIHNMFVFSINHIFPCRSISSYNKHPMIAGETPYPSLRCCAKATNGIDIFLCAADRSPEASPAGAVRWRFWEP